jgi:hypothetical protein
MMTVTLNVIFYLLHLPIEGRIFVYDEKPTREVRVGIVVEVIDIDETEANYDVDLSNGGLRIIRLSRRSDYELCAGSKCSRVHW